MTRLELIHQLGGEADPTEHGYAVVGDEWHEPMDVAVVHLDDPEGTWVVVGGILLDMDPDVLRPRTGREQTMVGEVWARQANS